MKNSSQKTNKKIKESFSSRLFDVINVIILGLLAFIMLYPLWHVCMASFSKGYTLMAHTGILLKPAGFSLDGYKMVFSDPMLFVGYRNTIFVVFVGTIVSMVLSVLGGYVLSRKDLLLKRPLMIFIIITMYFSGGTIPFFMAVKDLGLYNSMWALVLPSAVSTYNMIIMRSGFEAIPDSLVEAARIDGASHMTTLLKIVIPLAKPTMAVIALYYAVAKWNAWFHSMLFLQDREKFPLQLILRGILIENDLESMTTGVDAGAAAETAEIVKYGTIMVATVPILLLYPFLQKYFVKGVMIGGVKG